MLRLSLGDLVTWQDTEYTVTAATPTATLLCRLADGDRVWVDLPTLSAHGQITVVGEPAPDDRAGLTGPGAANDQDLSRARWWQPHLHEVMYGVSDPHDPHATPRPGYEDPSKATRRALKARELAAAGIDVSVRTLGRKEAAYQRHGLPGLTDRRATTGAAPVPGVDQRVCEAVITVLQDTATASTVSVTTLISRVRARLHHQYRAQDVQVPSDRTIRRLIERYDTRGLARGKATTRRSAGNRPDRGPRPITASYPGHVVEIDSTPANVATLMPDGTIGRASLTVALDVATRSILGFSLVPTGASGVEHADLLARILRPRQCQPDAPDWARLEASPVLPHEAMTATDARQAGGIAVPYIVPETITTDRGKDYLSPTFVAACRHFSISVIQAPPHSPTFKTHIERALGAADTLWMQKQPGYLGTNPTQRGQVERDGLLTLPELAASFEHWWVRVWQNRPHDGLRDRDVPARRYTPNQMYAAMFDASAGIPVPIDQDTYIALMPTHRRVLQPGAGFQVNHLTYWSDLLQPLLAAPAPGRDGKWAVHLDPYDTDRAWVAHPDTGAWIECVSDSYRLDTYPFASALRMLRSTEPADDPQGDWAQEVIAAHPTRISTKRAARKAAVLARRAADQEPRPAPPGPPRPPDPAGSAAATFPVLAPDQELWDAT